MNIGQLKQIISQLPNSMDIFMDERITDFTYGLVNSAQVKQISFQEEPDSKPLCSDTVLVLSEE